jgi:eukaryotic-like serine/threonine-protein kinase
MTAQRWRQVQDVLHEALEVAPLARRALVEKAAAGDGELLAEVWSLVKAAEGATGFLTQPVISAEAIARTALESPAADGLIGSRIGRYRILEQVGHGGMGAVYRAVRDDDEFEQEVAVKVARAGLDAGLFRDRFLYERQIHAFLNHPNIARLLDGGTTDDGRPYFVMELIEGETILNHCAARSMSLADRVELFRQVCTAVEYAHRHLVVHRDLKPSNILITPDGQPKLLDFGIAKLLLPDHPSLEPSQTAEMARVLTPEYASPEQVRGGALNTSTDVYSLGLVLYEMLTGKKGQEMGPMSPGEVERAVCEREPVRPSRVNPEIPGDLENIVLKAIEKDPARRYLSVEQFSEDLRRYLGGRPVRAKGNGRVYRLSKFIRRNKAIVGATAAVILTLVGGIVTTTRQARIAEHRFQNLRKLVNTLVFEMDALEALPGSTAQRRRLVEHALEYMDGLDREAGAGHELRGDVARIYEKVGDVHGKADGPYLGNTAKALTYYEKSMAIREDLVKEAPALEAGQAREELSRAYVRLAGSLKVNGRARDSIEYERRALGIQQRLLDANPGSLPLRRALAATLQSLGLSLSEVGNDIGALDVRRQALTQFEKLFAAGLQKEEDYRALVIANTRVASVLSRRQDYEESARFHERALAVARAGVEAYPRHNPLRSSESVVIRAMASDERRRGRLEQAEALTRQANVVLRRLHADDVNDFRTHSMLATSHFELAEIHEAARRTNDALAEHRTALAMREDLAVRDPANAGARIEAAQSLAAIGRLLLARQERPGARDHMSRALAILLDLRERGRLNQVGLDELAAVEKWRAAP